MHLFEFSGYYKNNSHKTPFRALFYSATQMDMWSIMRADSRFRSDFIFPKLVLAFRGSL